MAPGGNQAPHGIEGGVDDAAVLLYHANTADEAAVAFLHATVIPNGEGSSIVGEFRFSRTHALVMTCMRWFITVVLLGVPVFGGFGILRNDQAHFSSGMAILLLLPVALVLLVHPWLRGLTEITDEDTRMVRDFIERAIEFARLGNSDEVT